MARTLSTNYHSPSVLERSSCDKREGNLMNEYDPYQSPPEIPTAVRLSENTRQDMKEIASYQKGIIACILLYMLAVVGQFALPTGFRLMVGLSVLGLGFAGMIFVILLGLRVYSTPVALIFAILALIPGIGLLVLLFVNGRATEVLRQNGIKVGLLGASFNL